VGPRGIDQAGADNVKRWVSDADPRDVNVVRELLHQVEWQQPWKNDWFLQRFPGSDDYVVWPRPGLLVVIREFSDYDPEGCFSVPYIFTETDRGD
jgi:hypothetical protein